tara:strand:- start:216 stop:479 length:264 start_codon:yes stop_codon:yes gene_type:complete
MGVNHRHGYDRSKVEKMGKMYSTIDFERNDNYLSENYRNRDKAAPCGVFMIGGKEFRVSVHELRKISETASAGAEVVEKAYKLGLLS